MEDTKMTFDDALNYVQACEHGIVKQLKQLHRILKIVHRQTEDDNIKLLAEEGLIIVESQLDL